MVKLIDNLKPLLRIKRAKKLFVLDTKAREDLIADELETGAHLAEDERPMRRFRSVRWRHTPIHVCHRRVIRQRCLMMLVG